MNETTEAQDWTAGPDGCGKFAIYCGNERLKAWSGKGKSLVSGLSELQARTIAVSYAISLSGLRRELEEASQMLFGFKQSAALRAKMGIRTEDAKWLDSACHKGCQSLAWKAEIESLRAQLAQQAHPGETLWHQTIWRKRALAAEAMLCRIGFPRRGTEDETKSLQNFADEIQQQFPDIRE